jgi:hypothetical protein
LRNKKVDVEVSTRNFSKEKLSRKKPAIAAGKKQQQQQSSGADGQAPKIVWDPGGFQQSWEAHEQELMNFSQQWSMMQEHRFTSAMRQLANTFSVHSMEERGANPLIFKFEIVIKCCKAEEPCRCLCACSR